jgi:hypothetical protein
MPGRRRKARKCGGIDTAARVVLPSPFRTWSNLVPRPFVRPQTPVTPHTDVRPTMQPSDGLWRAWRGCTLVGACLVLVACGSRSVSGHHASPWEDEAGAPSSEDTSALPHDGGVESTSVDEPTADEPPATAPKPPETAPPPTTEPDVSVPSTTAPPTVAPPTSSPPTTDPARRCLILPAQVAAVRSEVVAPGQQAVQTPVALVRWAPAARTRSAVAAAAQWVARQTPVVA